MRLIVLPLTQPKTDKKQELAKDVIDLAKQVKDEKQQTFAVAGILTAADKFIDKDYSNQIKEWLRMTKISRLFEEEKIEAVIAARKEQQMRIAQKLLLRGHHVVDVMEYTELTRDEVTQVQLSISA